MILLYKVLRIVKCIEIDSRMVLPGEEEYGVLLNEHRVSTWKDGKILEINGGDGCTTIWKYCTLKMVNMVNFMYILPKIF